MKWLLLLLVVGYCRAEEDSEIALDEDGEARFGFITLGNNGDLTVSFNGSSIATLILFGGALLLFYLVILPLLGGDDSSSSGYGSGYDTPEPAYGAPEPSYSAPATGYAPSAYTSRMLKHAAPKIMELLSQAYTQWADQ